MNKTVTVKPKIYSTIQAKEEKSPNKVVKVTNLLHNRQDKHEKFDTDVRSDKDEARSQEEVYDLNFNMKTLNPKLRYQDDLQVLLN